MTLYQKIVYRILDVGLADSTWRELHPQAYEDLLEYRVDMEDDVFKTLTGEL